MNGYRWLIAIVVTAGLVLGGCGGGNDNGGSYATGDTGGDTNPPPNPPSGAVVTDVGVETDVVGSGTVIGAAGGQVRSKTRDLTIDIPAGALDADTAITITPITSTGPGAAGPAWRLGPDGTKFNVPVTLTFSYAAAAFDSVDPEHLYAEFQNADGTWTELGVPVIDIVGKTVSVQTTHFTDVTLGVKFRLNPDHGLVKTNTTLPLIVEWCTVDGCAQLDVDNWFLQRLDGTPITDATYGTIVKSGPRSGLYTAPATIPGNGAVVIGAAFVLGNRARNVEGRFQIMDVPRLRFTAQTAQARIGPYIEINATDSVTLIAPWQFGSGTYGNYVYDTVPTHAPIPWTVLLTNAPTSAATIRDTRKGCRAPTMNGAPSFGNITQIQVFDKITLWGDAYYPTITMGSTDPKKNCLTDVEVVPWHEEAVALTINLTWEQLAQAYQKEIYTVSIDASTTWAWTISSE